MYDSYDDPEGATPLDPDELEGLKFTHITMRGELDELEQSNIQSGLLWLERRRSKDILDSQFLRKLHKQLFGDVWSWAGTFRTREKNIGIDPIMIGIELQRLLDDARYWAENKTYIPLEAAALFHHRLVQIHAFPNGNGRHARISTDLYLSEYFNNGHIDWNDGQSLTYNSERRDEYIAALRAADAYDFDLLFKFIKKSDNR